MNNKKLWEYLGLDENCTIEDVETAYSHSPKSANTKLAWKVLRDKYYGEVYKTYQDLKLVEDAGFFVDKDDRPKEELYSIDFLTTPFGKVLDNLKNNSEKKPIVLLSTGGFAPLHKGHFLMMEFAKKALEKKGYNVVGGYFSPSHDSYFHTKPFSNFDSLERVERCQEMIKDSDWLMIDPWESIYAKTYLNFTDILNRLEKYLRKYVCKDISVAYVFGADNSKFMYCFEKQGYGVCIERMGYESFFNDTRAKLKNERNIFIKNKSAASGYSSRYIRQKENFLDYSSKVITGKFLIRDESFYPFQNYLKKVDKTLLKTVADECTKRLIKIIRKSFDLKVDIELMNLESQLAKAKIDLNGKNTISLDTYFVGNYNIDASRLFDVSDYQHKYKGLNARIDNVSLIDIVKKIKPGRYVLVDDDSATGKTIQDIISILPADVDIENIYLLSSISKSDVFEIADFRDFIVGGKNSGLLVRLSNSKNARAPYILPYVNMKSRSTIPTIQQKKTSLEIWKLNEWFYNQLGDQIKLKDTDLGFKRLMKHIGFDDESSMVEICSWHIKNLK